MLLLGFLLGIVASGLAWLVVRLIVPKIYFVPDISKVPCEDNKNGWRYRFKFYNTGRREIIDLQMECRYRAKKNPTHSTDLWFAFTIPLDNANTPRLRPKLNLIYEIRPAEITAVKGYMNFDDDTRKKIENGTIAIEELLSYNGTAHLRIFIFGYDAFSGTRRLFISKEYKLSDIKEGVFSRSNYKTEHVIE